MSQKRKRVSRQRPTGKKPAPHVEIIATPGLLHLKGAGSLSVVVIALVVIAIVLSQRL